MNLYYNPEKFGLEVVAELEYSSRDYCFDTRIVWREKSSGRLLSLRDSGCSCPSPFEGKGLDDCAEVVSIGWLKDEIASESSGRYGNSNLASDAVEFLAKVEAAIDNRPKAFGHFGMK